MFEILNIEVLVPLFHIGAFVILVSVCFLFHRDTLGLLIAFLFVFNWASFANRELILEVLKDNPYYWITYVGGGTLLVCLAGLGVMATTKRKKMEQERLQSERFQGALEMAGATCHELNQPMQIISGLSQLIQMDISDDDPLKEKMKEMKAQIDRMAEITEKIMNIAKYEARDYLAEGGQIIDIYKASKKG